MLIEDSKNCPLKSSKSLFDKFSFNKVNNSSLYMEVVCDNPLSIINFLAIFIISGLNVPVIGPLINPDLTKHCSSHAGCQTIKVKVFAPELSSSSEIHN